MHDRQPRELAPGRSRRFRQTGDDEPWPRGFARIRTEHGKSDVPPTPCNIVASILGWDGTPLVTETVKDLGPNEARFLDLPHPGGKSPLRSTRVEILDLVRFTPGHEIGSSLQIIDLASGSTTLIPPVPFATFPIRRSDPEPQALTAPSPSSPPSRGTSRSVP